MGDVRPDRCEHHGRRAPTLYARGRAPSHPSANVLPREAASVQRVLVVDDDRQLNRFWLSSLCLSRRMNAEIPSNPPTMVSKRREGSYL